jgi:hypothetical protein
MTGLRRDRVTQKLTLHVFNEKHLLKLRRIEALGDWRSDGVGLSGWLSPPWRAAQAGEP